MKKKVLALTLIIAVLCSLAFLNSHVETAEAITIGSNGAVTGTDKIRWDGNVFTLTGNVEYTIRVERSNIIIDGGGYTLEHKAIGGNDAGIIILPSVNHVTIRNFKLNGFVQGIVLKGLGNVVTGCTIAECSTGIRLNEATDNTITDNTFINNNAGMHLDSSSNNRFRNNRFKNSSIATGLDANYNDIDTSNMINGKPIFYFANQRNLVISPIDYPEIGYLALVNCTGMTVRDIAFSNSTTNGFGVILKYTTNSTIANSTFTNVDTGIYCYESHNNTFTGNYIANNRHGIAVHTQTANIITRNQIENNEVGISLMGSAQIIYHNNFINNTGAVDSAAWHPLNRMGPPYGMHVWDNGGQGNFWSYLYMTDADNNSIADVAYVINEHWKNTDHYPLMEPVPIEYTLPLKQEQKQSQSPSQPFPTTLIIPTLTAFVAIASAGAIVYSRKRSSKRRATL